MENREQDIDPIGGIQSIPEVLMLFNELRSGLSTYHQIAEDILHSCGVHLKPRMETDYGLDKHFFSFLFMYSYYTARIPESRRILYAATLQCLRGMVTGCDNLLDDEYKKTLDTDLPEDGFRIRSVIDIMISDRVLFQVLMNAYRRREFDENRVMAAMAASMKTMTGSAIQEASEESGVTDILVPEDLLSRVHHYKTGLLFTCPWDIPQAIEDIPESEISPLMKALYHIGMGCQILDDMVDFADDLRRKRHNYLASIIFHGPNPFEKSRLMDVRQSTEAQPVGIDMEMDFPAAISETARTARQFLEKGLNSLLLPEHRSMAHPCIRFLVDRIGAARFMDMGQ